MKTQIQARDVLRGMARALDIRGSMGLGRKGFKYYYRPRETDQAIIASDWEAVMHDFGTAFSRVTSKRLRGAEEGVP